MARSWYAFVYGDDPTNILNYYKITAKHDCLCGNRICAIYATGNDTHPEGPLSENMLQYINKALITGNIQPETPYNTKKYVYLKY